MGPDMSARRRPRRRLVGILLWGLLVSAGSVAYGSWSSLPDAVARLQQRPEDAAAQDVLRDVERSLVAEAEAGHLAAVAVLMGAYENLVGALEDGEDRIAGVRARTSRSLTRWGDSQRGSDLLEALRAWAMAAGYEPLPQPMNRLRSTLLPPPGPEPGAVWVSPWDGSELVYHAPLQFGFGCTWGDNDCDRDEIGRWVSAADFWIERTEVTNRRYRRCVEAGVCSPPVGSPGFGRPARADEPVVGVTWWQARDYAMWAGRRLPSEVEWERAARGVDVVGRFPWGRGRERGRANLEGTGDEDSYEGLAPVASFAATGYGVFDLAGNVWEWCADTYHSRLDTGPVDERARVGGGWGRVLRGGSWRRTIELARASSRTWQEEDYYADDVGFRCVADVPDRVPDQQFVQMAKRSFPVQSEPGFELAAADLSAADRRYLERMSLTWLVLEGRVPDALPRAAAILRNDPRDPVAQDLLDQLEREIAADVTRGDLAAAEAALNGYRRAVQGDPRLARRLEAHEQRLLQQVRLHAQTQAGRGDRTLVTATLRFARTLDPDDPFWVSLSLSMEPAPGTRRVWPGDGKGMVWVPGGQYRMGASPDDGNAAYDEHPAHPVTVSGFWLDQTEVTNDEYRQCVEEGACDPPHRTTFFDEPNYGDQPVLWVDWFQARSYARWAGKRLPSEAEWEWAARAGSTTRFPWGDPWLDGAANGLGAVGDDHWGGPSPVASFEPNPWGLYDMVGNGAEWVQDLHNRNYWGAPGDSRAWLQLTGGPVERKRVVRGGSFSSPAPRLRVSYRDERGEGAFNRGIGFRCAAD